MNKKIVIPILLIVTIITSYIICKKITVKKKSTEVNATPSTSKVIVLDAGHGKPDEGAVGIYGTTEEAINLKITLKLKALLEESGAQVILTRSDENGIYSSECTTIKSKKVSDIKNRVKIGNNSSADIFVSIHLNKIPQNQYWGWQTFYKDGDENSKFLATSIQNNLNETISSENKRVPMKLNNVYIMKHVEIPIALVECGFLSNKEEASKLVTDEYQDKIAWGIYDGIMDYFNK